MTDVPLCTEQSVLRGVVLIGYEHFIDWTSGLNVATLSLLVIVTSP